MEWEDHDDKAWTAILERDATQDGELFYGVRTTGIYCRPSCPAKRPKRENVTFFRSVPAAEAAGFRSCKRCRPGADATRQPTLDAVERARSFLDEHVTESVPLHRLAREVGISGPHLHRAFRRIIGLTPKAYHDARRVGVLKQRLRSGDTVSRAAFEAGFGSVRAAYERGEAGLGMSPGAYRAGGSGVTIRFSVTGTRFGGLLVGGTDRGLCAVSLAGSRAELRHELGREFPAARIVEDPAGLEPWAAVIREHLEGSNPDPDLPLDLSGTEFQRAVWSALRDIPYGGTRTYREIARSMGRPTAARAVGQACAANRVALVIPCHRVVREGGKPGGYRWGTEVKAALLEQERKLAYP